MTEDSIRRARMLIRTWNILVLLRQQPQTIELLASACGVHPRTIRRDLEALQAAQFPITVRHGRWWLGFMAAWPSTEQAPIAPLDESPI